MNNLLLNSIIILFVGFVGVLVGTGAAEIAYRISRGDVPEAYALQIEYFGWNWNNYTIEQHIIPVGALIIPATWTAEITRNGVILCRGSDVGNYEGQFSAFTPDSWTGSQCPIIQEGDTLVASWEYTSVNNNNVIISIVETVPPRPNN